MNIFKYLFIFFVVNFTQKTTKTLLQERFCNYSSFGEFVLANRAKGAFKILGKVFKLRSGSDTVLGCTKLLVIFPSANVTHVLFHNINLLYNSKFNFLKLSASVILFYHFYVRNSVTKSHFIRLS